MKCLRKRKRPTYFSCIEGALDLPPSGSSVAMREPTLIPTIITLTPARTAHVAQVELSLMIFETQKLHQDSVTVDEFIRQVTAVPEPRRKRKLLTKKLQSTHVSSPGSAPTVMQPAAPSTHTKLYSRNQGHKSPITGRDRKPMALKQRLARAAILSHVETNEILHSPAISSSRPPLNFVPFQKFATPPPSRKRAAPFRGGSSSKLRSRLESSTGLRRPDRYQRLNPIPRRPGSCRSSCPPLTFIPLHEAEDAYAAKFS